MSSDELKVIKVVEEVFEKKLKEIITIFKTNQPTENSRVAGLIKQELEPIRAHLEKQDIEFGAKFTNIETKIEALNPVSDFIFVARKIRRFVVWVTPLIAIGLYKLFK